MDNLFSCKQGHLNYVVSQMCNIILQRKGLSYATICTLVGELECIKQELYSKVAVPYEEEKANENGEVYGEGLSIP